jgi:hypothetical protein
MSTTSQNAPSKVRFGSGHHPMDNRILYWTLALCTSFGFVSILVIYAAVFRLNPANLVGYGLLVSVPPALGALVVVKLTTVFEFWRGAFVVYLALFALMVVMQAFGRTILG